MCVFACFFTFTDRASNIHSILIHLPVLFFVHCIMYNKRLDKKEKKQGLLYKRVRDLHYFFRPYINSMLDLREITPSVDTPMTHICA